VRRTNCVSFVHKVNYTIQKNFCKGKFVLEMKDCITKLKRDVKVGKSLRGSWLFLD